MMLRRQLAKVYKGHPGPGGGNMIEDMEVYDELGRGGYGTVFRAVYKGQVCVCVCVRERGAGGACH